MKKNILIIIISIILVVLSVAFFLYTLTVETPKLEPEEVIKDVKVEKQLNVIVNRAISNFKMMCWISIQRSQQHRASCRLSHIRYRSVPAVFP